MPNSLWLLAEPAESWQFTPGLVHTLTKPETGFPVGSLELSGYSGSPSSPQAPQWVETASGEGLSEENLCWNTRVLSPLSSLHGSSNRSLSSLGEKRAWEGDVGFPRLYSKEQET